MIDEPLDEMTESLELADERHPQRKRLVVFASDGENTREGSEQHTFAGLDDHVDGGLVLGYGTESGGKMPIDEDDPTSFIYDDSTHEDALSKIDEENLTDVASDLGGDYRHRQEPGGLGDWADDIEQSFADEDDSITTKHEVYWMFALGLFVLALLELAIAWRGFHASRRELKQL